MSSIVNLITMFSTFYCSIDMMLQNNQIYTLIQILFTQIFYNNINISFMVSSKTLKSKTVSVCAVGL